MHSSARVGVVAMLAMLLGLVLVGCNGASPAQQDLLVQSPDRSSWAIAFDAQSAWGGETRCSSAGCRLILVDHRDGQLGLYALEGRRVRLLDRQPLGYHPDSAKWLDDGSVVAAVEQLGTLDIFQVVDGRLAPLTQIKLGFPPRDVVVLASGPDGTHTLLATPYGSDHVALVRWQAGAREGRVDRMRWCKTPWHPTLVARAPGAPEGGVAVACLDDKRVVFVPGDDWRAPPQVLADYDVIPRQARPSPSGKWLYVALETGRRLARIDMDSGASQFLQAPETGAVSVAPLDDNLAIWGDAGAIFMQQYDDEGRVLETRWLPSVGFPTSLQVLDVDADGQLDLVVLNSSGKQGQVIFGPLWERASLERIK